MSSKSASKTSAIGEDDTTKVALDGHEGEKGVLAEEVLAEEAAYRQSTTAVNDGDDAASSENKEEETNGKDGEELTANSAEGGISSAFEEKARGSE